MTASSARRLVRHQVTFMLTKTAALFLPIIVESPGNIPGVLILFEGGNPVRVTGIFPCQAGFEQSNPLLVTTSSTQKTQYWYHQNKPERTSEFQAVRSGFCCLDWHS